MTIQSEIDDLVRGYLRHDDGDLGIAAKAAEIGRALTYSLGWVSAMKENAVRRALVTSNESPATIASVADLGEGDIARIRGSLDT